MIDKNSPIPAYYQLRNILTKQIKEGKYAPGNLIPSERELSEKYELSRMTVRQAVTSLVNDGILYRKKGKGTFVSKVKLEQRNIMSFSEMVKAQGMTPSTKLLFFELKKAKPEIIEKLNINSSEFIYNIKRLRLADSKPVAIENVFLPQKYCNNLTHSDVLHSLYALLLGKYGYKITSIENTIQATMPDKNQKEILRLSENIPVLQICGLHLTKSGLKLYYEEAIYSSHIYTYKIRIS